MAEICTVIKGYPSTVSDQLNTLAISNTILVIRKTEQAFFLVVYENSGTATQHCQVVQGSPKSAAIAIQALITSGKTIDIISDTSSSATYLVVTR